MKIKPVFFTSDWHIGHANVIKFDNRPFKDLDEMHETLINNHNYLVPKNGVCYHLGDFGFCDQALIKSVISRLNGTKILIKGNHDKKSDTFYYGVGFDVVLNKAAIYIANTMVTMSHCPLMGVYRENTEGMGRSPEGENWHGESRKLAHTLSWQDEGQYHLAGHIHSPNGGKSETVLGRQLDVGVVAHGYFPVSIKQILDWIVSGTFRFRK